MDAIHTQPLGLLLGDSINEATHARGNEQCEWQVDTETNDKIMQPVGYRDAIDTVFYQGYTNGHA